MKIAVVTPYYKEPERILRRCLDSVQAQTHGDFMHYLVADGHPHAGELRGYVRTRWIDLPVSHRNFGNTPRGIGGACALAEGADLVYYLDADNLVLPNHLSELVRHYRHCSEQGQPVDAVFARRYMFPPDHEHMRLIAPEDTRGDFVDTSCISLARSAGFLWAAWASIPQSAAPMCDRVMCWLMQHHQLRVTWMSEYTVLYESNWAQTYHLAGLPVPESGLHDATLDGLAERFLPADLWSHLRLPWNPAAVPVQRAAAS